MDIYVTRTEVVSSEKGEGKKRVYKDEGGVVTKPLPNLSQITKNSKGDYYKSKL